MASLDQILADRFLKSSEFETELARRLAEFESISASNHLQSTTRNMALHISSLLQNSESNISELSGLIGLLTVKSFFFRALKLRNYIGECDGNKNEELLAKLFAEQTQDLDGKTVPFEIFQETVQREIFGIVITAHPTFSISKELTHILAELVVCCDKNQTSGEYETSILDKKNLTKLVNKVSGMPHGSSETVTLEGEMEFALMALRNIRQALRRVYRILFSVVQKVYPDDWQKLLPKLLTVATWVGYDLDGRSDIGWSVTFKQRIIVARLALEDYLSVLEELAVLEEVQDRLRASVKILDDDLNRLDCDPKDPTAVAAFSKMLVNSLDRRLVDLGWVIDRLTEEIKIGSEATNSLAVLRAEMANFGIAFAHTHVRLNANQISNAVRHETLLTSSPEDPANRRRYIRNISTLLESVEAVQINFGSIMSERTTAKRLLMIVAQFLKYVDVNEPIRFLVAECNSAFTVLSTLYLAKLFGVEYKIDISPLFETSHALEQGHEIISELLDNAEYIKTIQRRGRICIQMGYSDAGRYIGQIPASLAVERTRIKLAKLLVERELTNIELVIFDTHGESIGRGAHPVSFADRLDFTYPPACRGDFINAGIQVKQEVSFQGGDGYVYFSNPDLSFATLCRLLEHKLSNERYKIDLEASKDPFYKDSSYSLDFFLSVKAFNERLIDNPDYAKTLDLFGPNLLYSTGSRNMKRQYEGGGQIHLEHPSQLRAIPHNAILQQLGYFSNSISGLGEAMTKDQDGFDEMLRSSDRFRRLISMVVYSRYFSDLDRLHGYISIFDPTIWMRRLAIEANPERIQQMQHLTNILRKRAKHEQLNRVYQIFLDDTVYLDRVLDDLKGETLLPEYVKKSSGDISILHGIRIALIHEIFLLISRIPRFTSSTRSADEVVDELLHLNIKHGIKILRNEFPKSEPIQVPSAFGELATYRMNSDRGYEREHRELFDPIENLYGLVCRVGSAITHFNNGVG